MSVVVGFFYSLCEFINFGFWSNENLCLGMVIVFIIGFNYIKSKDILIIN